jgi:hypothetical protein
LPPFSPVLECKANEGWCLSDVAGALSESNVCRVRHVTAFDGVSTKPFFCSFSRLLKSSAVIALSVIATMQVWGCSLVGCRFKALF